MLKNVHRPIFRIHQAINHYVLIIWLITYNLIHKYYFNSDCHSSDLLFSVYLASLKCLKIVSSLLYYILFNLWHVFHHSFFFFNLAYNNLSYMSLSCSIFLCTYVILLHTPAKNSEHFMVLSHLISFHIFLLNTRSRTLIKILCRYELYFFNDINN